jgi:hypothetical protein
MNAVTMRWRDAACNHHHPSLELEDQFYRTPTKADKLEDGITLDSH